MAVEKKVVVECDLFFRESTYERLRGRRPRKGVSLFIALSIMKRVVHSDLNFRFISLER